MDNSLIYVLAANVVIWLGLGGYAAFLGKRQAALEARLAQMEKLGDGEEI